MNEKPLGHEHGGIRIEISHRLFARMIDSKALTIAEIRCLDAQSKQRVWQACLEASLRD